MPATSSDIAIVGAGVVGLSVTHALRERGVDVTCFDHGEPGQGQSAGSSRVFRHHVGTPELAALAVESRSAWQDWSERAGEPLLRQDGWVRLGGDRAADLALLTGAGIPATELDPDEAIARMPVIARPERPLLLDPLGGATRTDATIAALVRWTAPSLRRARVLEVEADGDAVLLRTDRGEHRCARCLVCAGTGTDRLAAGAGLPIAQHRRVHGRLTFRRRRGIGAPMPSWSDRSGDHGEAAYGLAPDPETYAVGIAALDAYPEGPPESEDVPPGTDLREPFARIVAYVARRSPASTPSRSARSSATRRRSTAATTTPSRCGARARSRRSPAATSSSSRPCSAPGWRPRSSTSPWRSGRSARDPSKALDRPAADAPHSTRARRHRHRGRDRPVLRVDVRHRPRRALPPRRRRPHAS